jgi:hypothetical protein
MNFSDLVPDNERYTSAAARQRGNTTGHVHFEECRTCGNLVWISTNNNSLDGVTVTDMLNPTDCKPCLFIHTRNPELYDWMIAVVAKTLRNVQKRVEQAELALHTRISGAVSEDPST